MYVCVCFVGDAPWSELPHIRDAPAVRILIRIEPLEQLNVLYQRSEKHTFERKNDFARRIGKDLYHFMTSFERKTAELGTVLVLPNDALEKWFAKFQTKLQKDAKFLKTSAD